MINTAVHYIYTHTFPLIYVNSGKISVSYLQTMGCCPRQSHGTINVLLEVSLLNSAVSRACKGKSKEHG